MNNDIPVWCRLRELRELGLAERLYIEDDAHPPDAETLNQAYKRITQKTLPSWKDSSWSETYDGGDAYYALDKSSRLVIVWSACADSEIALLASL